MLEHSRFPELRQELWRGVLWSSSPYYVGTAGHVSAEIIERYIRNNKPADIGRILEI